MVKRIAAQYVFLPSVPVLKQHVVELDETVFRNVFPLEHEIASVSFFNGILILLKQDIHPVDLFNRLKMESEQQPQTSIFQLLEQQSFTKIEKGDTVFIYLLEGIDLLTAKFGTSNSRSHCHIQRLG
ncbi:MAG: hypothetical protein LBV57_03405 [Candidatus Symbiothrix sp.]|jgi:uncharacterized protein (UPF0262 family)|nr:hypothetical protein [Candidatus Symbiothrix sp.]